ncbi:MAG: GNAT family N-acetyltransferase [Runella sp.]
MLILRPATAADVNYIYDFLCELESEVFDFEIFKSIFIRNLQNPDCHYILAFDEALCIGYGSLHAQCLLHHCGKVGEIQELFVSSDYRSRGVGALLLRELEAIALREKLLLLEVTPNQQRTDAIRFYERYGLQTTHFKLVKKLI